MGNLSNHPKPYLYIFYFQFCPCPCHEIVRWIGGKCIQRQQQQTISFWEVKIDDLVSKGRKVEQVSCFQLWLQDLTIDVKGGKQPYQNPDHFFLPPSSSGMPQLW